MLKIATLSQKGGVGKSTIARLIARTYAAADWRVKIADFNLKQTTCVDWNKIRLAAKHDPAIHVEAFNRVDAALSQDYHLMVLDGKPEADQLALDLARVADVVVVPTGTSQDDLLPQIRFANELRKKGIPSERLLLCIHGLPDNGGNWARVTREYLKQTGFTVAVTEVPYKVAYQSAQNTGRAISETPYNSLNDKAEALAEEIAIKLNEVRKQTA